MNERDIKLEEAVCPICETSSFSFRLKGNPMDGIGGQSFQVVSCRGCGLLLTSPRPTRESISAFYEGGLYETGETELKRRVVNPVMKLFHKQRLRQVQRRKATGRLLDIGSGKGKFVNTAAEAGWEAWGVEPSRRSLSFTDTSGGARVFGGRFEDAELPDAYFDAVTMWHTLEHFHDPLAVLRQARAKLKDDGLILIRVPNSDSWDFQLGEASWLHLDLPRHLYHFSPSSLQRLLDKAGFRIVALSSASLEDNPVGMLQTVMAKAGFPAGALFSVLKGGFGGRRSSRALLTLTTAGLLALPALMMSEAAQLAGRGDVITAIAAKKSGGS